MYIGFHSKNPLEVPYQNYPLMYCFVIPTRLDLLLKNKCQKLRSTLYLTIATLDPPILA
jgi:hypothetical protein